MAARTETAERRLAIYGALTTRNRIITWLRFGLPLLGVLVFLGFVLQIYIASLGANFAIGRIRFSGDAVMVDTPSYSGVMPDGDVYKISAAGAQASIGNLNVIDLQRPLLKLTKPDGSQMTAEAGTAAFETLGQVVSVPGTAEVSDSRGNSGVLQNVVVNLPKQTVMASGKVSMTLSGGMKVTSDSLAYDAKTDHWDFGRATVTLPVDSEEDPGDSP
ncbi:MAG TPA: hypothetical protein VL418_00470 [Devosiaceae bacterium]|jgi:hypothetical protein|nr:hypothetical protein [Devosiaceae bacterium]